MSQWVYKFGGGAAEGDTSMKNLLGGKGANLAEMASLGLPVPPGFTLTTGVCTYYYDHSERYPDDMDAQIQAGIAHIEALTEKRFGDPDNPLLVSVRSGARASMPGMMDTVLNLGLNDETVEGLAKLSGDRRFALDSYRRFITMYSDVVMGVHHHVFEDILEDAKLNAGYLNDTQMTEADWDGVITAFKRAVREALGKDFPQDAQDQLKGAVDAVFGSWMNERAVVYRTLNDIPAAWGTAVNVQAMVFGNMGDTSATGVAFTPRPQHRRGQLLRRVSDQRAGRGRGRRHPHAADADQGRARSHGRRAAVDGRSAARRLRPAGGDLRGAGTPLPRHAGYRIHRGARQALDAADPHGQAHRPRRAEDRGRHGGRRADRRGRGGHADRPDVARPAPASDARCGRAARPGRDGLAGLARRSDRRSRLRL